MDRREELSLFLEKADELIGCKYILADTKIVALLKCIACSKTILAILQSSLNAFDFNEAKHRYLIRSEDNTTRGEYVVPTSTGDVIALSFSILMAIDSNEIEFASFLKEYFYADGSVFGSYSLFINQVIKPFKNTLKTIMEGIIDGKIKDPKESIVEKNDNPVKLKKLSNDKIIGEKEFIRAKTLLVTAKTAVLTSEIDAETQADAFYIIENLIVALEEADKNRIKDLYTAYKYFANYNKKINLKSSELYTLLKEGRAL